MARRRAAPVLAAALLAASDPAAAAPQARPRLAVLDLAAEGATASLAAAATGAVATELDRLAVFQVISAQDVRAILALERQKAILGGCTDGACLTEIGGLLGADFLVSGRVTMVGAGETARWTLDLTLAEARRGTREGSAGEAAGSEAELVRAVPRAVGKLTSRVLAARSGRLLLTVSEAGAAVKVDDQVKGTTPLPGPLEVASGPRAVSVEKKGFVAWQKDVPVQAGRLLEEQVSLVPSPDFIREYEARAGRMRLGAWIATGTAAAGAAVALAFQLRAGKLYGDSATPGTFLYYKQKLNEGAVPPAGADYRAEAQRLSGQVSTAQNLSYAGMGVAAVGAGVGAWLWIAGDSPGRYARYRGASASVDLAPLPGGAALAVAGAF